MARTGRRAGRGGAGDAGGASPGTPRRRVLDRCAVPFIWIPRYLIEEYGPTLGPLVISTYVVLRYHAHHETAEVWPSLNKMAEEMGASRSTVERSLRALKAHGLIEVHPCIDRDGQHSNWYVMLDPGKPPHPYPPLPNPANLPTDDPGRRLIDGAPPSISQGGAVPRTAPPRTRANEQDPVSAERARTGSAPLEEDPTGAAGVGQVAALWLALLVGRSARLRADHDAEIRAEVGELLRRGWTVEQLTRSIADPERPRAEWPREWRGRLPARPPKVARTPPDPAEARQKALSAAEDAAQVEKARAELLAAGGIRELAKRIGKRVPNGDGADL